jgi:CRISPR/Cas system-associated exonuclease Cas4 (RecB family)
MITAQEAIKEIEKRRYQRLQSEAKNFRQTICRASSIGECDRELCHSIIDWQVKPLPDLELQARFDEGKEQHKKVHRELLEDGFDVIEGEKSFEIKGRNGKVVCTGHIDGRISYNGIKPPFEIKSLTPNLFNQINSLEDFNKWEWSRKYPRQMQLYLFGENEEQGIYILSDCLGHRKYFPVVLDYEETERILHRCEYVMACVEEGILPPFHKDYSVCRRCWAMGRVCAPDIKLEGAQIIDDPEIEAELKRREELKELVKEFDALDKHIKDYFKEHADVLVGDFHITGKWNEKNLKPTEAKTIKYWQSKIEFLKGGEKDERRED